MNLIKTYQDGVSSHLHGDLPKAISYHHSLLKHYIFYYANTTTVDPILYALDSILVLHSKVWLQIEQAFSSHRFQSQTQKQQKFLKAQGILEGAEILLIYLKNKIGFTRYPALKRGFKSLETVQKILKRKTERYGLF